MVSDLQNLGHYFMLFIALSIVSLASGSIILYFIKRKVESWKCLKIFPVSQAECWVGAGSPTTPTCLHHLCVSKYRVTSESYEVNHMLFLGTTLQA